MSFPKVFVAAEMLSKGIDISKYNSINALRADVDNLGDNFSIAVDDATKDFFNLKGNILSRQGRTVWYEKKIPENFTPNLTLTIDKVKDIMKVLYELNLESFSKFNEEDFIPNFKEYIAELDKNFNEDLPMMSKLARQNTNTALKIFLALFNYKNDYSKKLYYDSAVDKDFSIIDAQGPVIDNRMYIYFKPSDMRKIEKIMSSEGQSMTDDMKKMTAFVISKNIYDYFWASYGNSFQSCFALNSEYSFLYGYVPFAMAPESFICYATTGGVNKIPVIAGNQFLCPNMLFRCWGYADTQKNLLVDKRYKATTTEQEVFIKAVLQVLSQKIKMIDDVSLGSYPKRKLYDQGKNIYNIYKDTEGSFYADSLRVNGEEESVYFQYSNGNNGIGCNRAPWKNMYGDFITYASTISKVSDTLTLDKPWKVVNDTLMNPKICPVTGLFIDDTEEKSIYAKYFTKDCEKSFVFTYLNGYVFLDAYTEEPDISSLHFRVNKDTSRQFTGGVLRIGNYKTPATNCTITLKNLKEMLKGHFNELNVDGVLLRYFEGTEVKYQFYKGK